MAELLFFFSNVFHDQELADACNAESDDMEMKFMSILCVRSFPHLRKGKSQDKRLKLIILFYMHVNFTKILIPAIE